MFKKLWENKWNSMSKEEQEAYLKREEDKKKSVLYTKDVNVHCNFKIDDCSIIIQKDEEDKLHLSICDRHFKETGDRKFWGYYLDRHFIEKVMSAEPDSKFMLDMGSEIYLTMSELQVCITEGLAKLKEKGIKIVNYYYPSIRPILKGTVFE